MSHEPMLQFDCPNCGHRNVHDIEVVPVYDLMSERMSDAQGYEVQSVVCEECEHEFDVGIENTGAGLRAEFTTTKGRIEVINDPIEFPDESFLDEFEQYEIENVARDPKEVFQFAVHDIEHVFAEMQAHPIRAVPRMLFVQFFSAAEAYLSDRLIGLIDSDDAALAALVKRNIEWKDEKIEVRELSENPNALKDWVKKRLRDLIYHNFVKIDMYFRGALGSTIFPNDHTKKTLMRFLPVRHDCVHRYGRDKDGQEREITNDDLEALSRAVQAMVDHVEAAFKDRNKKPPV